MKWCIETNDGEIYEVTNLYDARGNDTEELDFAEAIVIKFSEDNWQSTRILAPIHRIQ